MNVEGFSELKPLGQGGLGDVYMAVRDSTGSSVAIKTLRDWSDSSVSWRRVQREVKALVGLQGHANVISVHEVVEHKGVPLLVMELAPNGSVADRVRERGSVDFPDAVLIGEQTARALAASHALGIYHLDIKPQNLLIGSFGQIKVCDFGIAALVHDEKFRTATNAHSLRFSSPEILNETADPDGRSDIYSLGATLAYAVNGVALPVVRTDPTSAGKPFQLEIDERYNLGAQQRFEDLVNTCLRLDPAGRPSADELEEGFREMSFHLGSQRSKRLDVDSDTSTRRLDKPTADPDNAPAEPSAAPDSHGNSLSTPPSTASGAPPQPGTPVASAPPQQFPEYLGGLAQPSTGGGHYSRLYASNARGTSASSTDQTSATDTSQSSGMNVTLVALAIVGIVVLILLGLIGFFAASNGAA